MIWQVCSRSCCSWVWWSNDNILAAGFMWGSSEALAKCSSECFHLLWCYWVNGTGLGQCWEGRISSQNLWKTWNTVCYAINKYSPLRFMASTQKQHSYHGSHVFGSGKLFYKLIWRRSVKLILNSLNCNFFLFDFLFHTLILYFLYFTLHYNHILAWFSCKNTSG